MKSQIEFLELLRYWKKRLLNIEPTKGVFYVTAILIIIGLINVYSSTIVDVAYNKKLFSFEFLKQLIALGIGLLACMIWHRFTSAKHFDYRFFKNPYVMGALIVSGIVSLLVVDIGGTQVNGAQRWLSIGPLRVQPSEFTKIIGIIWTAYSLEFAMKYRKRVFFIDWEYFGLLSKGPGELIKRFFTPKYFLSTWMLIPILFLIAIIPQRDLGGMILNAIFPGMMVFYAGAPVGELVVLSIFAVLGAVASIIMNPYRLDRIKSLYDPFSVASSDGFQAVQSMLAVHSGGFFGVSLGGATSKYNYLPEAHTDFAFAVYTEEWGMLGVILLIGLFVLFAYYGNRIARNATDLFGSYLAFGIVALISFQAVYNMLMVMGAAFVTGVPMPFISYGSTALLMNIWAVAILLSVGERTKQAKKARARRLQQELNRRNFAPPMQ